MSKILITGGAGYIGSHTIVDLLDKSFEVISVDNFSNSKVDSLKAIETITGTKVINYNIDITDIIALEQVFQDHPDINGIIHFAAYKYVGESTKEPMMYYRNNMVGLLNILDCQQKYSVKNMIFSSSCSVYGNPDKLPVHENTPLKEGESPYARTKQMCEQIIQDVAKNSDLNYVILRYFNPAGNHESGILRENSPKEVETLVPIIEEVYKGTKEELVVFGSDYPTRDGSCIRDYIHIMDLADAHTKSIEFLEKCDINPNIAVFNLGTGQGITVLEMIKAVEEVSKSPLNYRLGDRRDGDVVAVYADYSKANELLGWQPTRGIKEIFESIIN